MNGVGFVAFVAGVLLVSKLAIVVACRVHAARVDNRLFEAELEALLADAWGYQQGEDA